MTVTEREIKLAAAATFHMPSLEGLAEGIRVAPSQAERLSTTYFDTEDLRLARWGMSLRHRSGQGWTVKLPPTGRGHVLARPEIPFAGNGGDPPPAVVDLVRAVVRSDELHIQTKLDTLRHRIALYDADGALVADVFDDEVAVLEGHLPATTFRELEVELGDATPESLLEELLGQLRRAGADAPDPTPKYIRSLGSRAPTLAEITVPELTSRATSGDVVRAAVAASVVRLIAHDPVVRLDSDPEGVHQARVATRRLRSDLRTFRSIVEPAWASSLRDELGWLAQILGDVRDGDVQLERMRRAVARLPDSSRQGAERVLAALAVQREAAHEALLEALRSDRYVALLDRLVTASNKPELAGGAELSARNALPALVRSPWRSLEKRVEALGKTPTDDELHDIRVRTKRVRYAAEAVAPIVGKRARLFAATAADLQEVLGDLNDAIVAETWLRDWARGRRSGASASAADLASLERDEAKRSRARWRRAWRKLAAPRLRSWM